MPSICENISIGGNKKMNRKSHSPSQSDRSAAPREQSQSSPIRTLYDSLRLSKTSADTLVFVLSLSLVIAISVVVILAGMR